MEFLYRRLKPAVVVVAALFLAALFTTTLTNWWHAVMPVASVGLLVLLIIVLAMAFLVGEEAGAVEGSAHFTHHDVMPDFVLDDEDQSGGRHDDGIEGAGGSPRDATPDLDKGPAPDDTPSWP